MVRYVIFIMKYEADLAVLCSEGTSLPSYFLMSLFLACLHYTSFKCFKLL